MKFWKYLPFGSALNLEDQLNKGKKWNLYEGCFHYGYAAIFTALTILYGAGLAISKDPKPLLNLIR